MRPVHLRASAVLAGLLTMGGTAAAGSTDTARVSVVFVEPARFTDVKDGALASPAGQQRILDALGRFVREMGVRVLPVGQGLEVRVLDVDLAGEFEPTRGPQLERTRIYREVYPPRIELEFRLVDGEGRIVREGRRTLRDLTYLTRAARVADDPLRYEKALLADWLRAELAK